VGVIPARTSRAKASSHKSQGIMYGFADDTCIYASSSIAKKLENDINNEHKLIHDWSSANKMYMNPCKSTASLF